MPGEGKIVQNQDLGKILEHLYKQKGMSLLGRVQQQTSNEFRISDRSHKPSLASTEEIKEAVNEGDEEGFAGAIPSELPIKLAILGRAFSGKKTIASMLVEKYGGEKNIRVFNMDDIIKEALDYITLKKIDPDA